MTEATAPASEKKTRRKPTGPRVARPAFALAHVDAQGNIVVDKFSRNAADLLMAYDAARKNPDTANTQLITLTTD